MTALYGRLATRVLQGHPTDCQSDRRTAAERRHIWRQEVTAAVAGLAPDIAAVAAGLIISAIAC